MRHRYLGKIMQFTLICLAVLCLLAVCIVPPKPARALDATKTETTEALAWTLLDSDDDADDVLETGSISISDDVAITLHIDCCLASTDAHEGTEIIVQIASEAGVDGSWTTLTRYVACVGTAVKSDLAGDEAAGQTEISVTNPATGHLYDHDGKFIFFYHTGTIANSEIAYQVFSTDDDGDTITLLDGLDHAQTSAATDIYTVDGEMQDGNYTAVSTTAVSIPMSASQARVIFNNMWDDDGTNADVVVRVRVTKTTDIE